MSVYISDGKKLLNVEYDDIPQINDTVDSRRVISKSERDDEYALFLLDLNGSICCYVLNEIYILGKADGFDNLIEATEAWEDEEI